MPWTDLTGDVAELFDELQPDIEGALYRTHQWRAAQRREAYKLNHAQREAQRRSQKRYHASAKGKATRKLYAATPAGRAAHRRHVKAREQRLTAEIKALRAARPRVVIPPVGRPPELEAKVQAARAALLKVQRRRKIAARTDCMRAARYGIVNVGEIG